MLPTKFWAEMTWPDFQRADMKKVIAVLPLAAIESLAGAKGDPR